MSISQMSISHNLLLSTYRTFDQYISKKYLTLVTHNPPNFLSSYSIKMKSSTTCKDNNYHHGYQIYIIHYTLECSSTLHFLYLDSWPRRREDMTSRHRQFARSDYIPRARIAKFTSFKDGSMD